MSQRLFRLRGHTILEVVFALMLLSVATLMAMNGWMYMVRGERRASAQCELDMDVRGAIERLRSELRLSDMGGMAFHPPGPGPYAALSFPLARDDDGDGLIDMLEGGTNIIWDVTVVYHVAQGTPTRLMRTTFDPRDNTLSAAQRAEQLAYVVANGHGAGTYSGDRATTRVVFENFFTWSIEPKGATYDAYSPELRREFLLFGSIPLAAGDHAVSFHLIGKNDASTGYKIGVDTLSATPAQSSREAEDLFVRASPSGTHISRQYMAGGSWSGNYQLLFHPSSLVSNPSFAARITSDTWEETNFRSPGGMFERSSVTFDPTVAGGDYVLAMVGAGEAWHSSDQTQSAIQPASTNLNLNGHGVRVVMRGGDIPDGGFIRFDGRISEYQWYLETDGRYYLKPAIWLRLAPNVKFSPYAYIAEATGVAPYFTAKAGTSCALYLYRPYSDRDIVQAINVWSPPYAISRTNSYLLSFLIDKDQPSNLRFWPATQNSSYLLPNAALSDLTATSWESRTNVVRTSNLYAVEKLVTAYPATASYQSAIFDTTLDDPSYATLEFDFAPKPLPSGTGLGLQVRSGDAFDLADASAWQNLPTLISSGNISPGSGRYVQFRARLQSDAKGVFTPKLRHVRISWPGPPRLVEVAGTITKGPDYGAFEVRVDDQPLIKGLRCRLSIFKDVLEGKKDPTRLTSSMMLEIEPRNTGK